MIVLSHIQFFIFHIEGIRTLELHPGSSHWKCTNEWPLCSESPLYAITFHQEPDVMKQCSSVIRIYGKFEGRQPAEITIWNSGSLVCRCARRRSGRLDIILRTKPLNWGLVLCWIMSIQEVLRQDVHVTVKMNNENLFWSCFKLMKPWPMKFLQVQWNL